MSLKPVARSQGVPKPSAASGESEDPATTATAAVAEAPSLPNQESDANAAAAADDNRLPQNAKAVESVEAVESVDSFDNLGQGVPHVIVAYANTRTREAARAQQHAQRLRQALRLHFGDGAVISVRCTALQSTGEHICPAVVQARGDSRSDGTSYDWYDGGEPPGRALALKQKCARASRRERGDAYTHGGACQPVPLIAGWHDAAPDRAIWRFTRECVIGVSGVLQRDHVPSGGTHLLLARFGHPDA